MARLARVVLPGVVHHVTQCGVRSMDLFYYDNDRKEYLFLLNQQAQRVGLRFVSYCLMTNHVHLLVIPLREDSLRLGIGEAHRLYTRYINVREEAHGHLFQERFFSCPLDDSYFIAAARYVERNPVRAGLCKKTEDHKWSSAKYHLGINKKSPLIDSRYDGIPPKKEWRRFLRDDPDNIEILRQQFKIGRPLGSKKFIKKAEKLTGRNLSPQKPGPKKR